MATTPLPGLSIEARNRVVRDGHCPGLAGQLESRLHKPSTATFEEVQEIVRNRGWDVKI